MHRNAAETRPPSSSHPHSPANPSQVVLAGWEQSGVYPLCYERMVLRDADYRVSDASDGAKKRRTPSPVHNHRKRICHEGPKVICDAIAILEKARADGRTDAMLTAADEAIEHLRLLPTLKGMNEAAAATATRNPPPVTAKAHSTRNVRFGNLWSREGLDKQLATARAAAADVLKKQGWKDAGLCGRCGGNDHTTAGSKKCKEYAPRKPRAQKNPAAAAAAAAAEQAKAMAPINPVGSVVPLGC